jgi:hypothetical protein
VFAEALPVAVVSAALFGGLALMSNRPRGALIAQGILVVAAILVFIAILVPGPIAGVTSRGLAAFGVGVISASVAGMLYHLYLGRFDNVWKARGVFTLVYLITSTLFGFVFVSLI